MAALEGVTQRMERTSVQLQVPWLRAEPQRTE